MTKQSKISLEQSKGGYFSAKQARQGRARVPGWGKLDAKVKLFVYFALGLR